MTTFTCFLAIKYQFSNNLDHVCFEKFRLNAKKLRFCAKVKCIVRTLECEKSHDHYLFCTRTSTVLDFIPNYSTNHATKKTASNEKTTASSPAAAELWIFVHVKGNYSGSQKSPNIPPNVKVELFLAVALFGDQIICNMCKFYDLKHHFINLYIYVALWIQIFRA